MKYGKIAMKISRIGFGVIMASTPDELAKAKRYRDTHTTELREKDRVRNGQRKDYHQAYYASKGKRVSRFVGVDGEGRNLANGYHAYFMLRAGDRMLACRDGERRLRTRDILHFLSELPSKDRKSTRLNSSHQIISYAVFCLKKKKK